MKEQLDIQARAVMAELYEKAKNECGKYPYFVCDIRCVKHLEKVEPQESEDKE